MAINKQHKEFHLLDMTQGWHTPPGYPAGIKQKTFLGSLMKGQNVEAVLASCVLNPAYSPRSRLFMNTGKKFTCSPASSLLAATSMDRMASAFSRIHTLAGLLV